MPLKIDGERHIPAEHRRPCAILACDQEHCQWSAQMFGDTEEEISDFLIGEFHDHFRAAHPGMRFPFGDDYKRKPSALAIDLP